MTDHDQEVLRDLARIEARLILAAAKGGKPPLTLLTIIAIARQQVAKHVRSVK